MMVRFRTLALLAALLITGMLTGCKKDSSYDPTTATLDDFVGTWRGTLSTFKNNQTIHRSGDIIFYYPSGITNQLEGLMILDQVYVLNEIQMQDGTFYFTVLNSDTLNPLCINWNLSGYASHNTPQQIYAYVSGNECGILGQEFVSYEGNFGKINPSPDSSAIYCFGANGHQWVYDVVLQSTGSCQLTQQITGDNGSGLYTGEQTNDCGFPWTTKPLRWKVAPLVYSVLSDTADVPFYSFYLDARVNSIYYFYPGDYVNSVQLVSTEQVTVPAGTFKCAKFIVQITTNGGLFPIQKGYYWLNNNFGIVKYQTLLSGDSTNIVSEVLSSKNF